MADCELNLLVLRATDVEKTVAFYAALGIAFQRHAHPPCGEHYASLGEGCLFEIYPRKPDAPYAPITFGFRIRDLSAALVRLPDFPNCVKRPAADDRFGRSAIIVDPDGNLVILTEAVP